MAPSVPEAKHWVKIPRAVVLHRMETADCLDGRLFWAIILWSWCGPQRSEHVVLKDEKGWVKTDAKGVPIPAKLKDLRELLGLSPARMGSLSRAAARLEEVGSIRFGDSISGRGGAKVVYPIHEPPTTEASLVASTATKDRWYVGTFVVSTKQLPDDPVARTEAIRWLEDLNTEWNEDLKSLRTKHNELLEQGASAHGILIERSSKSRLAKDPPPTSQPTIEETPSPEPPPPPEPEKPKPAGRLEGGDSQNGSSKPTPPPDEVRGEVRAYLESIVRPGLTPEIVDEVASHITTKERLEAFKHESRPAVTQHAKTWKYWVKIAKRVAEDAPRYEAAKANGGNGHSPPEPKSRSELRAEAFAREMQAEVDAEAAKMYDRGVRYREPKTSAAGKEPPPRTMREQMIDTALRKIEAEAKAGG